MMFDSQPVRIHTVPAKQPDGTWTVDWFAHLGAAAFADAASEDMREHDMRTLGQDQPLPDEGYGDDAIICSWADSSFVRSTVSSFPRNPHNTMSMTGTSSNGRLRRSLGYVACCRTGYHRHLWIATGLHTAAAAGAAIWAAHSQERFPDTDDRDAGPGQGPFVSALVNVEWTEAGSPQILHTSVAG